MVYTPGVAQVCQAIQQRPELAHELTSAGNSVAVVTNGTAILGLGDIGIRAGMPVMEGKAVILIEMARVSAYPILVDTHDPDELVHTVQKIAHTFGAILLEDIAAPVCFEVEPRLIESLDIPVFHDDQHGTAVVTLAALTNALRIVGKTPADVRVVVNGAGAAGMAIARMLLEYKFGDIILCDRAGAIYNGRTEHMNPWKDEIARLTNHESRKGPLAQVMRGAEVFIGVSGPRLVTPDMVRSMAKDAIVFAQANPTPEIRPADAMEAGAAVAADGRSVNNALGFPGIFRGTLDAHARRITRSMMAAAVNALVSLAQPDHLVPDFMDREVHKKVAEAVKAAAK
jgi:malate dehydrogenase (oxaloacetate-decarboxylating)